MLVAIGSGASLNNAFKSIPREPSDLWLFRGDIEYATGRPNHSTGLETRVFNGNCID
jgi:hypothetical protein